MHTFEEEIEFVQGLITLPGKISVFIQKSKRRGSISGREGYCGKNAGSAEEIWLPGKDDKVYLQCFDADELKRIRMSWNPKWAWSSIWYS